VPSSDPYRACYQSPLLIPVFNVKEEFDRPNAIAPEQLCFNYSPDTKWLAGVQQGIVGTPSKRYGRARLIKSGFLASASASALFHSNPKARF
jgi:hypothetical protein